MVLLLFKRANQWLYIVYSFLLLGGSLGSSHHCQDVRWQSHLISEVVVAQPSLFCFRKVLADCYNGTLVHVPCVTGVLEGAVFLGALPFLADEVHANILLQISWEDVRGTGIGVF